LRTHTGCTCEHFAAASFVSCRVVARAKGIIMQWEEPAADYDFYFKVLALGNCGVGKTSILRRLADDDFCDR